MKRVDVMGRRAKEFQAKEAISLELRKWAIQRDMTPKERYALGPTGTWHSPGEYYQKYLPLWCPLSGAWQIEPSLPPLSAFMTLVRGGIVETSYVTMTNPYTGSRPQVYVMDSERTRDVLTRLQSYPVRSLAWQFIKTRLIQDTFNVGWLILFKQINKLRLRLNRPDWRTLLTGHALNIQEHVEVGALVDARKMPIDLLPAALRLLTVWLQDFLLNKHVSKGMIELKEGSKPRQIVVIYGQQQLVNYKKGQLLMFYLSNLDRNTVSFRRAKT